VDCGHKFKRYLPCDSFNKPRMARRHSNPLDDFFRGLSSVIRVCPEILAGAVVGVAVVAIMQGFLSTLLPVWLVTIIVAAYIVYGFCNEGLDVLRARSFRLFVIAFLVLALDLYFTVVV
jgi:hypothetical protein